MTTTQPARRDLHAEITNQLIAAIEAKPDHPTLPWRGGTSQMPINILSGNRYNGINIIGLWSAATVRGYTAPVWGTYRQWAEKGCQVRGGEKASLVVFYKAFDAEPDPEDGKDKGRRLMARASYVFNAAQVDGYTAPDMPQSLGPIERLEACDRFVSATGAQVRSGGAQAYFSPATDHIQMPDEGLFADTQTRTRTEGYYSVLLHELVHWSGAVPRLDRDMKGRFGDARYAAEELVAEIGAAFLCAELGITQGLRPDHAQYLATWLVLLRNDSRAIFTAAARASEAAAFLAGRAK